MYLHFLTVGTQVVSPHKGPICLKGLVSYCFSTNLRFFVVADAWNSVEKEQKGPS